MPVFKTGENEFVLDDIVRFNYRDWTENVPVLIQMKFDAKGNVKMSWMGDGKFKMFPAHLTPFGVAKDGAILANLYIMGGLGTGEWYGFGMNIVLRIPCNKDNIADIDGIEYEITSAYIDKE